MKMTKRIKKKPSKQAIRRKKMRRLKLYMCNNIDRILLTVVVTSIIAVVILKLWLMCTGFTEMSEDTYFKIAASVLVVEIFYVFCFRER